MVKRGEKSSHHYATGHRRHDWRPSRYLAHEWIITGALWVVKKRSVQAADRVWVGYFISNSNAVRWAGRKFAAIENFKGTSPDESHHEEKCAGRGGFC